MVQRRVLIEFMHSASLESAASGTRMQMQAGKDVSLADSDVPSLGGFELDTAFPVVALPGRSPRDDRGAYDVGAHLELAMAPEASTYLVRGVVEDGELDGLVDACASNAKVRGVFADVAIGAFATCPGSPVGTDQDVESLLCTSKLASAGMDGAGVLVAIVDSGINLDHLQNKGKFPALDTFKSWKPPGVSGTPGNFPVGHGTMCAYDALIAAPECTLLDVALLKSTAQGDTVMDGFLSDAILAFSHLLGIMTANPSSPPTMVVNNSWGMFHPSWDFSPGHPGNYSDNPNHPFNLIVGSLEIAGADILFAAGNCGADCPDSRCQGVTTSAIYGANSHPQVLSVAGVTVAKDRIGYSSIGPGRLSNQKPDLACYAHFKGSGVKPADTGTSAACPVTAGVVAAVRSKRPYDPNNPKTHPAAIRSLMIKAAEDVGTTGYDYEYGWGIVDGCKLESTLNPPSFIDPGKIISDLYCKLFPEKCFKPVPPPEPPKWWWLCQRHPWLCDPVEPGVPWPPKFPSPPLPYPPGPIGPIGSGPKMPIVRGFGGDAPTSQSFSVEEVALLVDQLVHRFGTPGKGGCNCGPKT